MQQRMLHLGVAAARGFRAVLATVGAVMLLAGVGPAARAAEGEPATPPIRSIRDNSFLIEEAYNQEAGVLQNIQMFTHLEGRNWAYTFTQEWPVPDERHQFSYTIPLLSVDEPGKGPDIGDLWLNYRYQLVLKDKIAVAPRLTLTLPTGKPSRDTGNGAVGIQACIPVSLELGNRWATHWNAGAQYTPNAEGLTGQRADTLGYFLGGSMVYAASRNAHLLVEALWASTESVLSGGQTDREDSFYISPGARFAINCKSGLQIVPGIAVPIGVGPSSGDVGVLGYLSLEFPFRKAAG